MVHLNVGSLTGRLGVDDSETASVSWRRALPRQSGRRPGSGPSLQPLTAPLVVAHVSKEDKSRSWNSMSEPIEATLYYYYIGT